MTLIDALAQPRLLLACLAFGILNLLLALSEQHVLAALEESRPTAWLAETVYLPLARVLCVLVFIALAYPVLFGLAEAPPLGALLSAGEGRTSSLINIAFLLSLLLPLVPLFGRLPSLVLPTQSLIAAAMLFNWLAQSQGVAVQLWPGWLTLLAVLVWVIVGQRLAVWVTHWVSDSWYRHTTAGDVDRVIYEMVVLFFQVPAILIYTVRIGRQLQ